MTSREKLNEFIKTFDFEIMKDDFIVIKSKEKNPEGNSLCTTILKCNSKITLD